MDVGREVITNLFAFYLRQFTAAYIEMNVFKLTNKT